MADRTIKVSSTEDDAKLPRTESGAQQTRRVPMEAATRRVGDDASALTGRTTQLSSNGAPLPLGVLEPGATICGDCVVEQTLYPQESQRPGLYLCNAPEGHVVVKVAATQFPPKTELWERLTELQHKNVLRTYRTLTIDGRYYDVQEYCNGGTMAERIPKSVSGTSTVTPEWIERVFVPQLNAALEYLHAHDIVHRDIKPANIYIHQEDGTERLVLADFDISSVLDKTRTSRDTQRAAGTWLYTAPEAFPRFVDDHAGGRSGRVNRGSDYYSLGISIIELLIGTTSLHQCQLPDLFDFYLQGGRVEIPRGIPGRLALLLRGLLVRNRRTRWGSAEVTRWLNDQLSDQDEQAIHDDEYYELARASRPYRMGDQVAVDLPSLAEVMFQQRETATEDLITSDILLNWIGNLNPNIARDIKRDRDRHYLTPTLVLHSAIMRCDPTRPFIFSNGNEALTPEVWIATAINICGKSGQRQEDFCNAELLHQLQTWLRLKEDPLPQLADAVGGIEKSPERVRLEELAYLFQPERPYALMRGVVARTPKELATLTYGNTNDWKEKKRPACYEASYQRWFDHALCAWLRQRGLAELATQCDRIREEQADEPSAAFETILRLLDPTLPAVTIVFDPSDVVPLRSVPYGKQRTYTLHYTTQGCGVPFGALTFSRPSPAVQFNEYLLRQREGDIEVTIDTKLHENIPQGITYVPVTMESRIAHLDGDKIKLSYRVDRPTDLMVRRVASGAGIGMAIFGIPRLLVSLLGESKSIWIGDRHVNLLWDVLLRDHYPYNALIIGVIVLAILLYGGFRLWIKALRNSEV